MEVGLGVTKIIQLISLLTWTDVYVYWLKSKVQISADFNEQHPLNMHEIKIW